MQSILIASKDKNKRKNYAFSLCEESDIEKIDIDCYFFEKTIGIGDIRNLQKRIVLKPIKSKTKAVIVDSEHGFTIEAQNALLKILEEPPPNTIIYLSSSNKNLMLETVLSRCKTIELKDNYLELDKKETTEHLNILISLIQKQNGEVLKLAQDITKNKNEVIPWLEKMILISRRILLSKYSKSPITIRQMTDKLPISQSAIWRILTSLQKAYTILKTTNANQRLVLENLLLKI